MDANLREVPRICDKIAQKEREGKTFFSFEYFPPKTEVNFFEIFRHSTTWSVGRC